MKPFILSSYKIAGKELLVKTEEGRTYSFRIYPKEENRNEKYYTRFIPERKEFGIFTADYDKIKSGNVTETMAVKLVHEATHYDSRVLLPAYSMVRMLAERFSNPVLLLLRIDNWFEDLQSRKILRDWFDEKTIIKAIDPKNHFLKLASSLSSSVKELSKEAGFDQLVTLANHFEKVIEKNSKITEKKSREFVDFPINSIISVNDRVGQIVMIYYIFDLGFFYTIKNGPSIEMMKILETGDLSKLASELFSKVNLKWFKYFHDKLTLPFLRLKINSEKDPFWRLRWRLEYQRLENLKEAIFLLKSAFG